VFAAWFITRFEAVFSTIAVEDEGFARCELLRISLPRRNLAKNCRAYSCNTVAGSVKALREGTYWLQNPACGILLLLRLNM
jgi:hypothetical protein